MKGKNKGWRREPIRHGLASQGVKTITKTNKIKSHGKEKISDEVLAQYEAVRRGAQTNMLDRTTVQRYAYENGFYDLVNVIEEGKYGEILRDYDPERIEDLDIPKYKNVKTKYELEK